MSRYWTQLRLRLRSLFRRRELEQEIDEELNYHLQRQIDEGIKQKMDPAEARYAALRVLGPVTQSREECRDMRRMNWMEDLTQDLRYGARTLRKNPAFSLVAVLTLALGIGATTAMFSVAYGILFRSLPYPDADRVAVVNLNYLSRDNAFGTMCIRDYFMWKENNHAFEDPSLFRTQRVDIGGKEGVPEQISAASVTAGFFPTLRAHPLIGRTFAPGEDQPAAGPLAVLSESMWRRRFGANPGVLGQTILVNGSSTTVIGVMPMAFQIPRRDTELWTNLLLTPPTRYGPWFYRGLARLKSGVTFEQAQAEMKDISLRMMQQNPYYKGLSLPVLGLRDALLGTALRPALAALAGAVGLVLLIAVANTASLMLARATVRRREMALRLSLGAGRGRVLRQVLTESVLLASVSGAAGLTLAYCGIQMIRVWNPGNLPLIDSVRLDWTVLAFICLISTIAGVLFGLAPAFGSSRTDLNVSLKTGGRSTAGQARGLTRAALVISEVALSLILLVGAGLLLRSFVNMLGVTGGGSAPPRQVLTMLISPGDRKYDNSVARLTFYDQVLLRARTAPGVESAAITDSVPPDRQGNADTFQIEGQSLAPGEMNPVVSAITMSPSLFHALGIPLINGRDFTVYDKEGAKPVAIVSEGFARRFFPSQQTIGKRIRQGGAWMEIVGVAGNVKYLGLTSDTDPAYYMPFAQSFGRRMFLVVRSSGDAAGLAEGLRREIQSIDPSVTLAQIGTMEQALDLSVSRPRFHTALLASFAGIALLLAAIGVYGLIAYQVVQRTQEIGLRMALGAGQGDVLRMVVRQGAMLGVLGIAVGLGGAFMLTRLLRTMLFGIGVTDMLTFAAAPLGITLVVLLATLLPALRASRISPVVALRYE